MSTKLSRTALAARVLGLLYDHQDRMTECSLQGYYYGTSAASTLFGRARVGYTSYVCSRVRAVVASMGLSGWVAAPDAPSSYDEIIDEVIERRRDRKPFRVWDGASDNSVFLHPSANHAFRCIHDLYHDVHCKGFDLSGEEWLATHWTNEVARETPSNMITILAACDGIGQVYYGKHSVHDFVDNQIVFVKGLFMWVVITLIEEGAL